MVTIFVLRSSSWTPNSDVPKAILYSELGTFHISIIHD